MPLSPVCTDTRGFSSFYPADGRTRWVPFEVEEAPILPPALGERLKIRSYRGWGVDDSTLTARFNVTPRGITAVILTPHETYFVSPVDESAANLFGAGENLHFNFASTVAAEAVGTDRPRCSVRTAAPPPSARRTASRSADTVVRHRYVLAVAATGEYTQFHGGFSSHDIRLNVEKNSDRSSFAVVSAGPDRTFQTPSRFDEARLLRHSSDDVVMVNGAFVGIKVKE